MNARARIEAARSRLIIQQPFFGVLASYLILRDAPEVETMATDGAHLFYAPEFVASLSDAELHFVMAHEAMHCALGHMGRIGARDLGEFNVAADLAINPELSRLRVGTMPQGMLLDWQYQGMGAEEIYAARAQAKRQQQAQQQQQAGQQGSAGQEGQQGTPDASAGQQAGEQGQQAAQGQQAGQEGAPDASGAPAPGDAAGQGSGDATGQQGAPGAGNGTAMPGENPADLAAPGAGVPTGDKPGAHGGTMGGFFKPGKGSDAETRELAETWQTRVRQAAAIAAKQPGDMPGFVADLLGEINRPAEIDYREIFRDFIDSRVATDYSFLRPNRRFLHAGVCLPGATFDGLEHVVMIGDSSGSMDSTMLENAAAEIVGAMDDGKIQRLTVIWADTEVRHVQEFQKGDTLEGELDARGGGGTRFDLALAWIAENASDATAIVYLTDGLCNAWGSEPDCPILWAIHGDSRRYAEIAARAPFGRVEYVGRLA